MKSRIAAMIGLMFLVSGCVMTPRVEMTRRIDFNYVYTPAVQVSPVDLMCCAHCTV